MIGLTHFQERNAWNCHPKVVFNKEVFESCFSDEWIRRNVREVGYCKRNRKVELKEAVNLACEKMFEPMQALTGKLEAFKDLVLADATPALNLFQGCSSFTTFLPNCIQPVVQTL